MITSLTNPQVKQAVKLRDGKKRREDGLFLIDGRREIQRAIESGIEVSKIFYYPDGCNKEFTEKMFSSGAEMVDVTEPVLEKIAYGSRDEGAVAIAKRPERTLDSLKLSKRPIIGVAEGVEKLVLLVNKVIGPEIGKEEGVVRPVLQHFFRKLPERFEGLGSSDAEEGVAVFLDCGLEEVIVGNVVWI